MIVGQAKLERMLDKMADGGEDAVKRGIEQSAKLVQDAAKKLAPSHDGALRKKILRDVEVKDGKVIGTVYTDGSVPYARYVEFGTGPKGREQHDGISPDVDVVYTHKPWWWIHESQLAPGTGEHYQWPYIETKDGKFYRCSGQKANPFMYPALKDNEEAIAQIIAQEVKKDFEEH